MKIAVTNTVVLNTGDAAILLALLKTMRNALGADTEFIVFDSHPETGKQLYPEINFRGWPISVLSRPERHERFDRYGIKVSKIRFYLGVWLFKHLPLGLHRKVLSEQELDMVNAYDSADIVVSTGGTYLVENYSLGARIFDFRLALILKKPLYFFTQSLGPFTIPDHQRKLLKVFESARLLLLRDARSQANLRAIGLHRNNTYVVSDSAFALADLNKMQAAQQKTLSSVKPKVAISVREWAYFKQVDLDTGRKNYSHAVCQLAAYLVRQYDAEVTFISTCQGVPGYRDDSEFADSAILPQLPDDILGAVKVNRSFHRPEALMQELQNFDLVVSTRLHMAILSLGLGIPVLPIAYEFKTQELFAALGLSDLTTDIEKISAEELCRKFDLLITADIQLFEQLFSRVIEQHYSALSAEKLIQREYFADSQK